MSGDDTGHAGGALAKVPTPEPDRLDNVSVAANQKLAVDGGR